MFMMRIRAFSLLVLLFAAPLASAEIRDPLTHFFNSGFGNFQEEAETAKADGQIGVMLMFESNDCPFCARMKAEVLNRSEVQDWYRKHFRIFMINIDGDLEITDFNGVAMSEKDFAFTHNRVRATPVFAFFDAQGKRIARYTGATSGIEEFMLLGRYVAEGHPAQGSFTRFKRAQRDASATP